jgi:hypothetical protein
MRLALLLAVLGSAPLAALEQTQLYGTWAIDQEALWETMKARPEFAKVPAEQQAMIKTMMTQQMGQMVMTWSAEGGIMAGPQGKKETLPPTSFTSTGPTTATVTGTKPEQKVQLELKGEVLVMTSLDPKAGKNAPSMTFKRTPAAK